jgi:hypothetical protein
MKRSSSRAGTMTEKLGVGILKNAIGARPLSKFMTDARSHPFRLFWRFGLGWSRLRWPKATLKPEKQEILPLLEELGSDLFHLAHSARVPHGQDHGGDAKGVWHRCRRTGRVNEVQKVTNFVTRTERL